MAQISRSHHTVPRFYLDGFADEKGFVQVVRLPGDIRYPQSVQKVSVINDFYNVGTGPDRDAVEKLIGDEIEAPAAEILRKVLTQGLWPLDSEARAIFATFMAVQHLRGIRARRSLTEIVDAASKLVGGKDGLPTEPAARVEALKSIHIQSMLDIENTAPYIFGRVWTLARLKDMKLLCCDTPISLVRHKHLPNYAPVGMATAWFIVMPLSRTTGLLMSEPPPGDEHVEHVSAGQYDGVIDEFPDEAALGDLFNKRTVRNARQCIYHHPGDANLVPNDLPEPNPQEIATVTGNHDDQ
ncbi:DUF4238 domain-containing protein [Mycobacterium sp. pR1184]|uniref:DUF4238 domain-containing protein n=1 Tax=Mycobacterium sp. pR1184 TaxID=3238981 RepID=UPI00351B1334